jgi:tetratricopeptide (TPR) repeat protein
MRRGLIVVALLALCVGACSKSSSTGVIELPKNPSPPPAPGAIGSMSMGGRVGRGAAVTAPIAEGETSRDAASTPAPIDEPGRRARYEVAVAEGNEFIAEQRWRDALTAFRTALDIRRDDLTIAAVDRLQRRVDAEDAAEETANNIQTVLDEGKPEDAARLAAKALLDFGNTDLVPRLAKLKREADALVTVGIEDRKARFQHFRDEYESAKEKNKRAALLALEQALQNGDEGELKATYEVLAADLRRYDELRDRATRLRREPERLEEAVAALKEAADVWSNAVVLQEFDECRVAMMLRRDRLAVLEFEEHGDVGLPGAGAFVAEALLPEFKNSYNLVERGQLGKVVDELRRQGDGIDDEPTRRALERATGARYVVVGSITPIAGVTVEARLVEAPTGLIVQTARVSAPTAEKLVEFLPQLAQDLMLTDDQKQRAESRRAAAAAEVAPAKPADDAAQLPPPDPPLADVPPPAPVIPALPKAPNAAGLNPEQLDALQPAPPADQIPVLPALTAERDLELRRRALFVALQLGDNLFRRGRFREAFARFEFALDLFPERRELRLRVERCRPLLPPAPEFVFRPRVAVIDFLFVGDVSKVGPYFGVWSAEFLAPYLRPEFGIADRAELYWWMGRLGLTFTDLVTDPVARFYVGRALGLRYFLFGSIVETASFNVTTYLVDADYGYLASSARVHVRTAAEMKLRLAELAWLTKMTPEQRRRTEGDNAQWALLMSDIRAAERQRRYGMIISLCDRGLQLRPGNAELLVIRREALQSQQIEEFQKARRDERSRLQDMVTAAANRQIDLAKEAHEAALAPAEFDGQRRESQRRAAAEEIIRQARLMAQAKRYPVAVQLFESAAALRPGDDTVYRDLATARARAEESDRVAAAEAQARREADLRRKREEELAATRVALVAERKRRETEEQPRRKSLEDRDLQEAKRLMDQAQQLSAKQQYEQAVALAEKAKQLRPTPEAERLVSQLLIELAKANTEKMGAAAKADLLRQLTAEREARTTAEAEADRNRKLYETLVTQGQKFLAQDKFDEAQEQFTKARKLYETDVALTGLNQAKAGKARAAAKTTEEQRRKDELRRQNDTLKAKLADAQAALTAKQLERAVTLFQEAKKLAPTDIDVLSGLAKAEQARDQELAKARRAGEAKTKQESFKRLFESGKASLKDKKHEDAIVALREATRLAPDNEEAKAALQDAEAKLGADAAAQTEFKKKADQYQAKIREGQNYMALKRYGQALTAFNDAKLLAPGDQAAVQFADEAERALVAEQQAARKAGQAAANVGDLVRQAREALRARKFDEAGRLLDQADEQSPRDPAVAQARTELSRFREETTGMQNRQEYLRLMDAGRKALQAKKYPEAIKAFESAVALFPQDAAAAQALAEAKKGQPSPPPAKPPTQPTKPAAYAQQMSQGSLQEKGGRYEQALAAYKAALQAAPNDADAATKVEFCQAMLDGEKALKQRNFAGARSAYEAALKLFPNDANAKLGLQRAKMAK